MSNERIKYLISGDIIADDILIRINFNLKYIFLLFKIRKFHSNNDDEFKVYSSVYNDYKIGTYIKLDNWI